MDNSNNKPGTNWDNLSFDDLDSLDWENIPVEHLKTVTELAALRKLMSAQGLTNKQLARFSPQSINTVTRKSKGLASMSIIDLAVLFATKQLPKEDIDALKAFNLKDFWNMLK